METACASLDFSDFTYASKDEPAPAHQDSLDRLEDWVKVAVVGFDEAAAAIGRIDAFGIQALGFGDGYFVSSARLSKLHREASHVMERVVGSYIAAHRIEVADIGEFVQEALGSSTTSYDSDDIPVGLRNFSAAKIRAHFHRTFGDLREASITQLRARFFRQMGEREIKDTQHLYCFLHERAHRPGKMRLRYETKPKQQFEDSIRYIIHVETGIAPADIVIPEIYGFNDGASEWDRKDLFKRQKAPCPGVRSLRFCADGDVELVFSPTTLSRLQAQARERSAE
jgi:hypothetical protein